MEALRQIKLTLILIGLDLTKEDLAKEVGADRANVSRVLDGKRAGVKLRWQIAEIIVRKLALFLLEIPMVEVTLKPVEKKRAKAAGAS